MRCVVLCAVLGPPRAEESSQKTAALVPSFEEKEAQRKHCINKEYDPCKNCKVGSVVLKYGIHLFREEKDDPYLQCNDAYQYQECLDKVVLHTCNRIPWPTEAIQKISSRGKEDD